MIVGVLGVAALAAPGRGTQGEAPPGTFYYSTAEAPRDYRGPEPTLLALGDVSASHADEESRIAPARVAALPPAAEVPRVASTAGSTPPATRAAVPNPAPRPSPPTTSAAPADDPIARAKMAITECQRCYKSVQDYTCTFVKRERIDGRLTGQHVMTMKVRTNPLSIYFKFQKPNRGREAIFVSGRHGNRVLAHDVGFGKFLAGTMKLDPRGSMAMEDNRHPITEAGIGALIDTVAKHWAVELTPAESVIRFQTNMQINGRPCTMIESAHPRRHPGFLFHMVRLYIDHEHGLPIRFEAYDWPKQPGAAPELVEEYTYLDLRPNVGLREADFDPANAQYSFGRF